MTIDEMTIYRLAVNKTVLLTLIGACKYLAEANKMIMAQGALPPNVRRARINQRNRCLAAAETLEFQKDQADAASQAPGEGNNANHAG